MKRYSIRDQKGLIVAYCASRDEAIKESRAWGCSSVCDERTGTTIHVTPPAKRSAEGWWLDSPELAVRDENGLEVARVHSQEDGHLIAAAPRLLEALQEALRLLERDSVRTGAYPQIRAAIAAAEEDPDPYRCGFRDCGEAHPWAGDDEEVNCISCIARRDAGEVTP